MFADTKAYADLGETVVGVGLAKRSSDTNSQAQETKKRDTQDAIDRARAGAAARSPFYAVYFATVAGAVTVWGLAIFQALIAASVLQIFFQNLLGLRFWQSSAAYVFLGLGTTLPFFVTFTMPDVFLSLGVLAMLVLLQGRESLSPIERAALMSFCVLASVFHTTHASILLATGAVYLIAARVRTKMTSVVLLLMIFISGPLSALIYQTIAKHMIGGDIYRPPFLTARLLEDGPGRLWLDTNCTDGRVPFSICQFRQRNLSDSQAILWERGTDRSVFADAPNELRIELAQQDVNFAIRVTLDAPVLVAKAALDNFGQLIVSSRLDDIADRAAVYRDPLFSTLVAYAPSDKICFPDPKTCAPHLDLIALGALDALVTVAAFTFILAVLSLRSAACKTIRPPIYALMTAVVTNDLICAAFSGPYARYHTRVSWLIPLAALLLAFQLLWRNQEKYVDKN